MTAAFPVDCTVAVAQNTVTAAVLGDILFAVAEPTAVMAEQARGLVADFALDGEADLGPRNVLCCLPDGP